MKTEVKWLGVVGTREVDDEIRRDIERFVGEKIIAGYSIVSGGATGADHEAARIAVEHGLGRERLRIYLPTNFGIYCEALLERGKAGKCRQADAEETTALLQRIARETPGVIADKTGHKTVDAASFHERNRKIVALANELVAFRVNQSAGTTYTVEQAEGKGIAATIFDYNR